MIDRSSADPFNGSERFTVHLDDLEFGKFYAESKSFTSIGLPIGKCAIANGCFDLLHPGHLQLLASLDTIAYKRGLRPIVAINSDSCVKLLKGDGRPVVPQASRSALINALKWPFTVVIFDEPTPIRLMNLLKPQVVVKGGEYSPGLVVKWNDSEVITVDMVPNWSTSKIVGDTR